ncbi:hypothetical protein MMC10_002558 [Thelotrema lepadinum]|nr:hypothetical protein [Thelotrema lepadinum]
MRTSFFSVLALASSFVSVLSAPAAAPAIAKRQDTDALALVTDLSTTLAPIIASITDTANSITADSSDDDKAAASSSITDSVASASSAIDAATAQAPSTTQGDASTEDIASIIANIVAALNGPAASLEASLGLGVATGLLGPLVTSLSGLLLALVPVVNNLLAVVQELVDGLLIGLAAALAGLVL